MNMDEPGAYYKELLENLRVKASQQYAIADEAKTKAAVLSMVASDLQDAIAREEEKSVHRENDDVRSS